MTAKKRSEWRLKANFAKYKTGVIPTGAFPIYREGVVEEPVAAFAVGVAFRSRRMKATATSKATAGSSTPLRSE
jgi:hypothetical protein